MANAAFDLSDMTRFNPKHPWIIAHRGASAWLPEHTLAAYARAVADGADAIEPDLVMTADGVLVARHGNELSASTDVAARDEFAARRTRRSVDGEWVEGWFVEDFTWGELQRLRAREPLPALRGAAHDGRYGIPSLDQILELLAREVEATGRRIGLVPELKHPTHFAERGLPMLPALRATLAQHPVVATVPVWVQCFEPGTLAAMRRDLPGHPPLSRLQLIGPLSARPYDRVAARRDGPFGTMLTPAGLREVAAYAEGIGVHTSVLMGEGGAAADHWLLQAAREHALSVFVYTFRPENAFLPAPDRGPGGEAARHEAGAVRELQRAFGVDAVFTDDPALARQAYEAMAAPGSSRD